MSNSTALLVSIVFLVGAVVMVAGALVGTARFWKRYDAKADEVRRMQGRVDEQIKRGTKP
jgi:hypothetical protein